MRFAMVGATDGRVTGARDSWGEDSGCGVVEG